jgi:hypothetical protein
MPASTSAFIDFECLAASSKIKETNRASLSRPVLLGALSDDGTLTQFILDPRLKTAAVARKCLAASDLAAALGRILDGSGGPIVGWSEFDAKVIEAAKDVPAGVKKAFAARYENARDVAKTWRRLVRPSIELPLNERGTAVHELKAYMRAIAFGVPRNLAAGLAAKWARRVLDGVEAADGRYSRVNKTVKRDWHRLLDYNRLDCEGLRAVCERAARELELWRSYEKTRFVVPAAGLEIRIGASSRTLRRLLTATGASEWAFISGWNPASVPLTRAKNDRRNLALLDELRRRHTVLDGMGIGDDASWEPEASFLVLGLSRARAVTLGRKYGQLAVVHGKAGARAELVACEP